MQEGKLPFTELLTNRTVAQALADAELVWNDRIYTPLVTLWVFLGQVPAVIIPVEPPSRD
ncbi:MAG: hypothetical protein R3C10_26190 [Pirellulales bacterium]